MKNKYLLLVLSLIIKFNVIIGQTSEWKSNVPGVVVAHSPKSTNVFLGSPSIVILPNGNYLASHDTFKNDGKLKIALTKIYLSKDKGRSWTQLSELNNQYWSSLFSYNNKVYLIGTSNSPGAVVIRESLDNGYSWSNPIDNKSGLLLPEPVYHCAPVPVVFHDGRIWRAMEDCNGPYKVWGKEFRSFMMSAPIDSDWMDSSNWTFSNTLPYNENYLNGKFGGWLEGNAVVDKNGNIVNILRVDYRDPVEKAAIINISKDGKTASFDEETGFIQFPGGCKKFSIRYDKKTDLYWTISNYIPDDQRGHNVERTRNTQALSCSKDLKTWKVCKVILHHPDVHHHGFQYIDWQFDGKDIIFLSRTAYDDGVGGADNQHNANLVTFHRVKNFRKSIKDKDAFIFGN